MDRLKDTSDNPDRGGRKSRCSLLGRGPGERKMKGRLFFACDSHRLILNLQLKARSSRSSKNAKLRDQLKFEHGLRSARPRPFFSCLVPGRATDRVCTYIKSVDCQLSTSQCQPAKNRIPPVAPLCIASRCVHSEVKYPRLGQVCHRRHPV